MSQELNNTTSAKMIARLCRYIDTPSTSGQEAAFLSLLEEDFTAMGFNVQRQKVDNDRWNLIALPTEDPQLIFSTHVDVVPPHIPSKNRDGTVYGRGACDTKGGLVTMIEAANQVDAMRKKIGFLLVVGEEVDHIGAIVASDLSLKPKAIVLCEPTQMRLIQGQKGLLKIALSSSGVAAHSAFTELGKDALAPLLDSLQRIRTASFPSDPVFGNTTVNIGLLNAGVAANITPPSARAELLFRAACDPDVLLKQVKSLCSREVKVAVLSQNPPVKLNTVSGFTVDNVAFNTDAYYLKKLAPVYLIGPGDIRLAHGDGELITSSELEAGVAGYNKLASLLLHNNGVSAQI